MDDERNFRFVGNNCTKIWNNTPRICKEKYFFCKNHFKLFLCDWEFCLLVYFYFFFIFLFFLWLCMQNKKNVLFFNCATQYKAHKHRHTHETLTNKSTPDFYCIWKQTMMGELWRVFALLWIFVCFFVVFFLFVAVLQEKKSAMFFFVLAVLLLVTIAVALLLRWQFKNVDTHKHTHKHTHI